MLIFLYSVLILAGKPGTGKTHTARDIFNALRRSKRVSVVASTAKAARLWRPWVRAQTLHSFCGLLDGRYTAAEILERFRTDPALQKTKERILETEVLIMDEISITSACTWDLAEEVIRKLRSSYEYFGGIQVCANYFIWEGKWTNQDDLRLCETLQIH